jgi:hypothetical protein
MLALIMVRVVFQKMESTQLNSNERKMLFQTTKNNQADLNSFSRAHTHALAALLNAHKFVFYFRLGYVP